MQFKEIIFYIIGAIGSLGLFAFGAGYWKSQFSKGSKDKEMSALNSANTVIEFWKSQAENLKTIGDQKEEKFRAEINTLTREVGEVRGQLTAETAQKKEYLAILQGKDEGSKKFMEIMLKFAQDQGEIFKGIVQTLSSIHSMVKAEADREMHIEGTVSKA